MNAGLLVDLQELQDSKGWVLWVTFSLTILIYDCNMYHIQDQDQRVGVKNAFAFH